MRRWCYLMVLIGALFVMAGCHEQKNTRVENDSDSLDLELTPDSTVYGFCGSGSTMHTLELITDEGDTLQYMVNLDEKNSVKGGVLTGDRMAVVGETNEDGEQTVRSAVNLTTLLGKWTSLDKNFEIQEGGIVKSHVKAETNPWVSWKICNGMLLLNKDTFQIDQLGADTLAIENVKGIFVYKRQN